MGLSSATLLASREALLICRNRSRSASVMSHPTYQGSLLVVMRDPGLSAGRVAVECAVDTPPLLLGPNAPSTCGADMPAPEAIHTSPWKRLLAPLWGWVPAPDPRTSRYPPRYHDIATKGGQRH